MKRFLKFYQKDKENIKMINQSSTGFELVVLSDTLLKELLEIINAREEGDEIAIVWQMKFKKNNYILYKNCTFSEPMDNFHTPRKNANRWGQVNGITVAESPKILGKKLKVTCNGVAFYSDSLMYKNQVIQNTTDKYKDATLLNRMLKIDELNLISKEDTKYLPKREKFIVSQHMGETFFELK